MELQETFGSLPGLTSTVIVYFLTNSDFLPLLAGSALVADCFSAAAGSSGRSRMPIGRYVVTYPLVYQMTDQADGFGTPSLEHRPTAMCRSMLIDALLESDPDGRCAQASDRSELLAAGCSIVSVERASHLMLREPRMRRARVIRWNWIFSDLMVCSECWVSKSCRELFIDGRKLLMMCKHFWQWVWYWCYIYVRSSAVLVGHQKLAGRACNDSPEIPRLRLPPWVDPVPPLQQRPLGIVSYWGWCNDYIPRDSHGNFSMMLSLFHGLIFRFHVKLLVCISVSPKPFFSLQAWIRFKFCLNMNVLEDVFLCFLIWTNPHELPQTWIFFNDFSHTFSPKNQRTKIW